MIGDYLGQLDGFHTAVMHAYVDSISFSDMKFGSAIGKFLKDFQLPGEAQKVDRIIEKFAERYGVTQLSCTMQALFLIFFRKQIVVSSAHIYHYFPGHITKQINNSCFDEFLLIAMEVNEYAVNFV